MLYFSEIKGKKVYTEDRIDIGNLEDLVFSASESPKVTKIVIRDKLKNKLIIPTTYLHRINKIIIIKKNYLQENIIVNELFVLRNLLDKQIIDIKGNKIVRVNDVVIQDKPFFYIAGVDIGLLGILRWLRLDNFFIKAYKFFGMTITSQFLSWSDIQPLELSHGHVQLKKEEQKLKKIRPEDLADYLEKMNIKNVNKILKILDEKTVVEVINNLNINYQTSILKQLLPEKAAAIISIIDPNEAVDILLTFSKKKRDEIINKFDEIKRKEILHLLHLSQTPIGDILTTEFICVSPNETVKQVINKLIRSDYEFVHNIYVVNENNELIGVFNLHELIQHDKDIPVYKFMIQNVIVIHLTTPKEIALKKMLKYNLLFLPVIDDEKHILGIVVINDIVKNL